jgi:RNA polymerase sigma-70 factor (ECF subfamily)
VADAEALFLEHRHRLFRYLCRAVGQVDTAQELTQDVFVRVIRAEVPIAGDGEVRAWLFRIARNLAIDHRRRERGPIALAQPPSVRHPAAETATAVNEALARLPEVDRDVFVMREVAGLSYAEIATACDLTADAVRSRIHRARLQLREHLSAPIARRRGGTIDSREKS